jgi:hypothetical protein
VWPVTLTVGEPLPVLPLWLRAIEEAVRVDLEAAYTEARQRGASAEGNGSLSAENVKEMRCKGMCGIAMPDRATP